MGLIGTLIFAITVLNGYHLYDWFKQWSFYCEIKTLAVIGCLLNLAGFCAGIFTMVRLLELS
jgi:hypothetical protein